jgi:tetratricopeptide (TPR) repeat protein
VFDFNLHIPANVLLLAFTFGIIANPAVTRESAGVRSRSGPVVWRLIFAALGVTLFQQAWQRAPGEYYAERARAALRDYHLLSAIDFARQGIHYEKRNPLLFYYLGRARSLGGDWQADAAAKASFYEAALPAYATAHSLAPLDKTYSLELGFAYDALQRFNEAEPFFEEARALDPKSTSIERYYQDHLQQWQGIEPARGR